MQVKAFGLVPRPEHMHSIAGDLRRWRHFGEKSAVRAPEPQHAVRLPIELVTLLVNGAVVAATEHGEIRERGRAPVGPVTDVMALAEADPAVRETAAAVAMVQRPA
jgi:hypothetical protein